MQENQSNPIPQQVPPQQVPPQFQQQVPQQVPPQFQQQVPPMPAPVKKPVYKKWWFWAAIAAVVLIVIGAAAGGSKSGNIDNVDGATNGGTRAIENDGTKADEPENTEKESEAAPAAADKTTVEEQILWENDVCKITALSFETDSIWGDELKVQIENKSDKVIHVGSDALIVNDYMITDLFAAEVAAGKKMNDEIDLMSSELEAAGIDNVGKIELYLYYYEGDSFSNRVKSDCITVKTSHFDDMDVTPNDAGTELYNQDGVRIVGKYVNENSFWGAGVLFYIENSSGKNVTITTEELSVNGFMITEYFYADIYDGKRIIDDMTLSGSDLKEAGIDSIEEIELKFRIREQDDYLNSVTTDAITFKVK